MIFSFADYELDDERFELRRQGGPVAIQPKALDLLLYLLRNRGRVVPKAELLAAVWPGISVTPGSLERAVSLARAAIGDRARDRHLIATVARRGYAFEGPVGERPSRVECSRREDAEPGISPYIGRAALIGRLEERLDRALAGQGRVLFLAGEAGIGKTRTAELLMERAARSGALTAAASGALEGTPPFYAWIQLLRSLTAAVPTALGALDAMQRRELVPLLPELEPRPPARVEGAGRSHEERSFALHAAVHAFLDGVLRSGPLALFLDDLHTADVETLALLQRLGNTLQGRALAVIVTCREEEAAASPRRERAVGQLLRLTCLERWPLEGLDAEEVRAFASAHLGGDPDAGLTLALARQTGGNPLLMGEGLRSLEARGLLGVTRPAHEWEQLLPRGVRHLLLPKLRHLSPAAREALGHAAALGSEVDLRLFASSTGDDPRLGAALVELRDARLLLPDPVSELALRFSHALVREALYAELVPAGARRQAIHARIFEALEQRTGTDLAERAHHACEAVPFVAAALAVDRAGRAGAQSASGLDFEGAAGWYARALALAPAGDGALRATLLLGLGAAETRAFGLERARASFREATDHARALGRADLAAEAALGFAHRPSSSGSADAETIALLEEAQGRIPAGSPLGIRLRSRLAVELRYADRPRAEALMAEAVAAARSLGDPHILAQALDDLSFVSFSPADPEGWSAINTEIVEVAAGCGEVELELAGQRGVVTSWLERGNRAALDREIRACARIGEALRTPQAHWLRAAHQATLALLDGELARAERLTGEAMRHGALLESPEVALEVGVQLVYLRFEQGRAAEMEEVVREQTGRFPGNAAWRAALARLLLTAGASSEARAELDLLARDDFAAVPRDRGFLPSLAMAAEVAFALGDASSAAAIGRLLEPFATLHVVAGGGLLYYGAVSHALGLAAATAGCWDAALRHLEQALAREEALGARLWAARARVDAARALIARGTHGDLRRSAALAEEGVRAARQHGWVEVVARGSFALE